MLILAYAAFVVLGLGDGLLGVAFPSLRAAFGLGPGGIGWLLAGIAAGYLAAGIGSGAVGQRIGVGRMVTACAALLAAGLACEASAPVLPAMMLGGMLCGLGGGGLDAGLNAYLSAHHSARHLNWLHGFYGVGATLGPVVMTGLLLHGASWRWGYGALCVPALCVCAVLAATRARWRVPGEAAEGRAGSWRAAAGHRLVQIQVVLFFVYTGLEVTLGQWTFSVFTEFRHLTAAGAGAWSAAYWGCFTGGRFVLALLLERVGADRLLRVAAACVVAGCALNAVLAPPLGGIGLVLAGVSLAPIYPTLIARAQERLGPAIAIHAIGFKSSAAMAGSAALPALAGAVAARAGLGAIGWVALGEAVLLWALHETVIRLSLRVRETV